MTVDKFRREMEHQITLIKESWGEFTQSLTQEMARMHKQRARDRSDLEIMIKEMRDTFLTHEVEVKALKEAS